MDQLREKLIRPFSRKEKPALSRRLFCVALVLSLIPMACDRTEDLRAEASASSPVDSILPMDEAVRRFRADLPVVSQLEGGAASRDELVRTLVRAIERNDTVAVGRLHVSRAEYAYLYFPTSVYVSEPYLQQPSIAWLLAAQNSEKGIARAMRRLGGHDLEWRGGYSCAEDAREGENTFARACTMDYFDPQDKKRVTRRLFGSIMERGGRFKFLSYANDF